MKPIYKLMGALALALPILASAETVKWKLGSQQGPKDSGTLNMIALADQVREATKGRFDIEVVTIDTMGYKQADALRMMKQNAIEAVTISPYYMGRDEPLLANFIPFNSLINEEDNWKVAEVQRQIASDIYRDKWGMVLVAPVFPGGVKEMILVSKDPINTLDQMRTKKIRHYDKVAMEGMRKLGLAVQTIPSTELYLAMKTGVIDASLYGRTYALSQSLFEVAKYYSVIAPFTVAMPTAVVVRQDVWDALPDDLKAVLQEKGNELYEAEKASFIKGEDEARFAAALAERGMTELPPFSAEDRLVIQKAVLDAWGENSEKLGPEALVNYERIRKALN